jgi:hypothetical protein
MTARSTAQGHAVTIRDETTASANTATRVGTNLKELADNALFNEDIGATVDLTSTALVAAGTTTAHVASAAEKLVLLPVDMGTITTGTTQPISFTDALFSGHTAGGSAVGTGGTVGVIASSFSSGAAETGTGSGQGGLGSTANSNQPYNTTDFAGKRYRWGLFRVIGGARAGEPVELADVLSTAGASFPASLAAPVFFYGSFRSDLGANAKWRGFFYFLNEATGLDTPFTPDTSISAQMTIAEVFLASNAPTSSGYVPVASPGAAEFVFGATGDIADLGTKAGGSSGKVADAAHVHQISTTTPAALGTAAVGTGTTPARADHVHAMPSADQLAATAADFSLNSHNATNMLDPGSAQHGATKNYCDTRAHCFACWGDANGPATTTAEYYNYLNVGATVSATENVSQFLVPFACTFTGIEHWQNTAYTVDTVTDTFRLNGVDTAVVCVLAANTTTVQANGFSVVSAAGDIATVKHVQSASQVGTAFRPRAAVFYRSAA